MKRALFILSLDSVGAFIVGIFVLLFSSLISTLNGWDENFTRFGGFTNLIYGSYSGILVLFFKKGQLRPIFVSILVLANSLWGLQCFAQVWRLHEDSTYIGTSYLLLEGAYVIALAYLEAKFVLPKCISRSSQAL